MSRSTTEKFFTRAEHMRRISDALTRRLYPASPLHPKVLAGAIGVTARTVSNWRYGKCDAGSWEFQLLCKFFERIEGSPLFLFEIYGDIGIAMAKRAAAMEKVASIVTETLRALESA